MCGFCGLLVCVCVKFVKFICAYNEVLCVVLCFCGFLNVWVCVCVGFVMCCICVYFVVCLCGFCNVWLCVCFDF